MKSKNVDLDLVVQLLEKKKQALVEQIQALKATNPEDITLKNQMTKAIDCLNLCQQFSLSKGEITFLPIPEGGSDGYFTSFYIVDEAEIDKIDDWAIIKRDGEPIRLSCFDIIGKR